MGPGSWVLFSVSSRLRPLRSLCELFSDFRPQPEPQDILSPGASFLVENVEFYHDQGGVTPGRAVLSETVKRNILRESDPRTHSRNATGLLHESCGPSTSDDVFKRLTLATESCAFARPILLIRSPRSAGFPFPAQESQPAVDLLCSTAILRLHWRSPAARRHQAVVSCSIPDPQNMESDT